MFDVIILAGGFGTRLRKVVSDRPKPMALINGAPFLEILIDHLKKYPELNPPVLSVGYQADMIAQYFTQLKCAIEREPLGTGGGVKCALEMTTTERVFVLNGDSFFDVNFTEMAKMKGDLVIAAREVEDASRYGTLRFNQERRLIAFEEKREGAGWINGGIYLMQRDLLSRFEDVFSLEKDAFPTLLDKEVFVYPSSETFIDIGTPDSYKEAQEVFA